MIYIVLFCVPCVLLYWFVNFRDFSFVSDIHKSPMSQVPQFPNLLPQSLTCTKCSASLIAISFVILIYPPPFVSANLIFYSLVSGTVFLLIHSESSFFLFSPLLFVFCLCMVIFFVMFNELFGFPPVHGLMFMCLRPMWLDTLTRCSASLAVQ